MHRIEGRIAVARGAGGAGGAGQASIGKGHVMEKRNIALEEKVAFLEESISRISKVVEEMNLQLVGLMKEVRNIRRSDGPVEPVGKDDTERPPHY